MHHAPSGPPLFARVAGLLARVRFRTAGILGPLGTLVVVLRRTRVLPITLLGVVLAAFALATPVAPVDGTTGSTAALTGPSDDDPELVPATGDGWTQDGAPPESSRSDRPSSSAPSSASSAASSDVSSAASSTADEPAGDATSPAPSASSASDSSSSASGSPSSSAAASSSSASPQSGSSDPSESESSVAPSAATDEEADADPAAEILAVLNAERAVAGCAALTTDSDLTSLAEDGEDAADGEARVALVATGADAAAVAGGWLADADDRAALLDCTLTSAGVAVSDGSWTLLAA